jgi:hypothetical protein
MGRMAKKQSAPIERVTRGREAADWGWLLGEDDEDAPPSGGRAPRRDRRGSAMSEQRRWERETLRWSLGALNRSGAAETERWRAPESMVIAWGAEGERLAAAGRLQELAQWEDRARGALGRGSEEPALLAAFAGVERWLAGKEKEGLSEAEAWGMAHWMVERQARETTLMALASEGRADRWAELSLRAAIAARRSLGVPEIEEQARLQERLLSRSEAPRGGSALPAGVECAGAAENNNVDNPWLADALFERLMRAQTARMKESMDAYGGILTSDATKMALRQKRWAGEAEPEQEEIQTWLRWASKPSPALILTALARSSARIASRLAWVGGSAGEAAWANWAARTRWQEVADREAEARRKRNPRAEPKGKIAAQSRFYQTLASRRVNLRDGTPKAWAALWAWTNSECDRLGLRLKTRRSATEAMAAHQWNGGARAGARAQTVEMWIKHVHPEAGWRSWAKALAMLAEERWGAERPFNPDDEGWRTGFLALWDAAKERFGEGAPELEKMLRIPARYSLTMNPAHWSGGCDWTIRSKMPRFSTAECAAAIADEEFLRWAEAQCGSPLRPWAEQKIAKAVEEGRGKVGCAKGEDFEDWQALSAWSRSRASHWEGVEIAGSIAWGADDESEAGRPARAGRRGL